MTLDRMEIERYFHIGDIIESGGRRTKFEIIKITDLNIRIQPTVAKTASRIAYDRLTFVVQNYERIDSARIEKSVGEVLRENGTQDTQNESYLYGFSREYLSRSSQTLAKLNASFLKSVARSLAESSEQRKRRLKIAEKMPRRFVVATYAFGRNPDVVAEVLIRANGFCENSKCKLNAPFRRKSDGSPYLEVHHRKSLSNDGEDTVENAIALCPNCHRAAHYG